MWYSITSLKNYQFQLFVAAIFVLIWFWQASGLAFLISLNFLFTQDYCISTRDENLHIISPLGVCFTKSAFNSIDIFQSFPQCLQFKRVLFRFLSDRVLLRVFSPRYTLLSLKIYFLKFYIFSWECPGYSSENLRSNLEHFYHLFVWFPSQLFALLFTKKCV